ncbi:hypothetical protein BB029_12915 [Pseudomonas sp. S3E12]|jgi:hypothetical protein|nr:hypothetical protein BB029_12915 [Pseudomonas sp. S3E12]
MTRIGHFFCGMTIDSYHRLPIHQLELKQFLMLSVEWQVKQFTYIKTEIGGKARTARQYYLDMILHQFPDSKCSEDVVIGKYA